MNQLFVIINCDLILFDNKRGDESPSIIDITIKNKKQIKINTPSSIQEI